MNPPTTWTWKAKRRWRETLQQFEGGVLLVSHDRQLISQSCNRFWLIEEGKLSEWHDAEAVFERLRESVAVSATQSQPHIVAADETDDDDALLLNVWSHWKRCWKTIWRVSRNIKSRSCRRNGVRR